MKPGIRRPSIQRPGRPAIDFDSPEVAAFTREGRTSGSAGPKPAPEREGEPAAGPQAESPPDTPETEDAETGTEKQNTSERKDKTVGTDAADAEDQTQDTSRPDPVSGKDTAGPSPGASDPRPASTPPAIAAAPHHDPVPQPFAPQRLMPERPALQSEAALHSGARPRNMVIKLPTPTALKLDAIAETRGGFRTTVALDILEQELVPLAAAHDRGIRPILTPVRGTGADRRSLSIQLPPHLADALDRVATLRKAVKHQILLRLLVPGIDRVYTEEIG